MSADDRNLTLRTLDVLEALCGYAASGATVFGAQLCRHGGAGQLLYTLDQADLHGVTPAGLG